jgi:hypothetical protein
MILYEDAQLDPVVSMARMEILTALAPMHKVHCYSNVDALEAFLEKGLDELKAAGFPRGLTRVVLVFSTPRALDAVERRMRPGHQLAAWMQPDAWMQIYKHIDQLQEMARKVA